MFLIPLSPHYPVLIFPSSWSWHLLCFICFQPSYFIYPYSFLCFKFAIILLFHGTEVSLESGEFQWDVWWCACFQKQTSFSNLNNSNMWRSILVNLHSQSSLLEIIGKYCLSLQKCSANLCEIAVASAKVDRYIGGRVVVWEREILKSNIFQTVNFNEVLVYYCHLLANNIYSGYFGVGQRGDICGICFQYMYWKYIFSMIPDPSENTVQQSN